MFSQVLLLCSVAYYYNCTGAQEFSQRKWNQLKLNHGWIKTNRVKPVNIIELAVISVTVDNEVGNHDEEAPRPTEVIQSASEVVIILEDVEEYDHYNHHHKEGGTAEENGLLGKFTFRHL